jgi:tetratricopeptide (TPR) repeat protein
MIERLLAAEAALERGDLDAAERVFDGVATADPHNAIALVGLARIAGRRGSAETARELAGRALAIDPEEAAALRLLAELPVPAPEPVTVPEPAPAPDPGPAPATPTGAGPAAAPGRRRSPLARLRAWLAARLR